MAAIRAGVPSSCSGFAFSIERARFDVVNDRLQRKIACLGPAVKARRHGLQMKIIRNRKRLDPTSPDGADLDLILDAALRAPDHGRLRPWRFVLIRGAAREELGEIFVEALKRRDPTATAVLIERRRARAHAAPLLIAVGAAILPTHPVPELEQLLAVGAAAMNLLNALHLLGYGGMWVTGADCYDPVVNAALGFHAPDRLLGFIYAGTPKGAEPKAPRPRRIDHVVDWIGRDATP